MKDLDRAMKYFIGFALGSAVALPLLGEVYANISKGIALFLAAAWAVWAGVKFSSLSLKSAMLGVTSYVFSSVILSFIGYLAIHPAAVADLLRRVFCQIWIIKGGGQAEIRQRKDRFGDRERLRGRR